VQQPDYRNFYGTPSPYQVAAPSFDSSSSNVLLPAAGQFSPAVAAGTAMLATQPQQQVQLRSPAQQQQQQQQQYFIATPAMQQQQQQAAAAYGRAASAGEMQVRTQQAAGPSSVGGAAAAAAGAGMGPVVQMSMQLTTMQMGVLTPQLYNIASMSGADISTVPVAGGVYYLSLTGAQSQVESARQLVGSVLSQLQVQGMQGMM
jgi:hypothetical protein